MIWDAKKARERFNLEHAPLGEPLTKLQKFLEKQLEAPNAIRSYGTASNPSQQLKNKLGQASTIPGGMLTLSVETKKVHDRAVGTLVEDWGKNVGWAKAVACVAIIYSGDAGWRIGTIVEWSRSKFPALVQERLFPDANVVSAKKSPAESGKEHESTPRADEAQRGLVTLVHEFERDIRSTEPNVDGHREREFRRGWKDANNGERAPYGEKVLRSLTWCNLGYRLGALFGQTSDDMISVMYDWSVRQQSKI